MSDQYNQSGAPNSSVSPDQVDQNLAYNSQSSPDAHMSDQNDPSGRMSSLNLGFLKGLTDKRSSRADGAQPKKRGPKPDSKPALTRRQELNRQAQRTHRERKEQYVKALEDEVVRLKEVYSGITKDKLRLAEENKKLKELLLQHGIPHQSNGPDDPNAGAGGSHDGGFDATGSGYSLPAGPQSQGGFSPGMASNATGGSMSSVGYPANQHTTGQQLRNLTQQVTAEKGMDYNQAGIDFVLTLERPCMNHLPYLLEKIHGSEKPCGHALMASCPPQPFSKLTADSSFRTCHVSDNSNTGQGTYDLSSVDLASLMDLSAKINLDGEITPIMAWGMIMSHPKFMEMASSDIRALAEQLGPKMRCFGFGAVTEEFEVRDAIAGVFLSTPLAVQAAA